MDREHTEPGTDTAEACADVSVPPDAPEVRAGVPEAVDGRPHQQSPGRRQFSFDPFPALGTGPIVIRLHPRTRPESSGKRVPRRGESMGDLDPSQPRPKGQREGEKLRSSPSDEENELLSGDGCCTVEVETVHPRELATMEHEPEHLKLHIVRESVTTDGQRVLHCTTRGAAGPGDFRAEITVDLVLRD